MSTLRNMIAKTRIHSRDPRKSYENLFSYVIQRMSSISRMQKAAHELQDN